MNHRAHIVGTGGYQPGEPISNAELAELVGPLPREVLDGLGIEQRFWLADPRTGKHRESTTDLATKAAVAALDDAEMGVDEVELILVSTGTPEFPLPPTANLVQQRLGLDACATMEVRSGGAGWVQCLDIARMYLERGVFRTALVIGCEAISPVLVPLYLDRDPAHIRIRDRMALHMFGDGAGAAVLRARDEAGGVLGAATCAIGGNRKPGIWSVGGGTHAPLREQARANRLVDLRVDVAGAAEFTPTMVTRAITDGLAACEVAVDSLDWCLVPEGNAGWMLNALREAKLDTPQWTSLAGRVIDSLATTGAVGSAAVPLFLDRARKSGQVTSGQRVLLVGVEATKWIYASAVVDLC
ncbi:ketoacyl-ACP synthase III [Solihabitans fulvus]|uniref:Ketoacyl-ACP synthase III n=1 Tax=Solihabitans fulvus TaxID=1892852 RepID=A0A5B2XHD5_9PSEU|nr:3-oxoacyl-[acyl-carrier-protein] synthase III C-terminal domain-containing protein [Solihabitans fulvus]KAA2262616.1 ketoacyl-ACP synthase III [Solihabitans fulvus]